MPPAKEKPSAGGVDPVQFALAGMLAISGWCAFLVHRSAQAVIDAANNRDTYVVILTDEGVKSDNEQLADQVNAGMKALVDAQALSEVLMMACVFLAAALTYRLIRHRV